MINLNDDVSKILGVGQKKRELLAKLKITKVKDLLDYLPVDYEKIEKPILINNAKLDSKNYILLKILGFSALNKIIIARANDGQNAIELKWFNSPYIASTVKMGSLYVAYGQVKKAAKGYEIIQPKLIQYKEYEKMIGSIIPTYSLTKGLTNNSIIKIVNYLLDIGNFDDGFDKNLCKEYGLPNYFDAVKSLHRPTNFDEIKIAYKRFIFKELYTFMYQMKMLKKEKEELKNDFNISEKISIDELQNAVGFKLTNAQKNAINTINKNLKNEISMSRLLQGDVGSGKTIVAFITMLNTVLSGYQVALMVPTEVLAKQHYLSILDLLKKLNLDIDVTIITSSISLKKKKEDYKKIENGSSSIIIGTHSLIWKDVKYKNLAYVVTDEQHRFGVNQRQSLAKKANNPHILVMSATPIPRTLAIMLYGDMDISIMDELPAQRIPIKNKVVGRDYEKAAYNLIRKEVEAGKKAYVVCPLVEKSESIDCVDVNTEFEKLSKFYNGSVNVGMIHGQMSAKQKNEIMHEFKYGNIDVLVSTIVIEVGVDVSNATVMVIVDPQRFGLAQLHQLRGRVGRSNFQSYCVFLVLSSDDIEYKRLKILEKTNDGFEIAKQDLTLRGSGEFFGVAQTGEMNFKYADIYEDAAMIGQINEAIDKYHRAGCDINNEQIKDTI